MPGYSLIILWFEASSFWVSLYRRQNVVTAAETVLAEIQNIKNLNPVKLSDGEKHHCLFLFSEGWYVNVSMKKV